MAMEENQSPKKERNKQFHIEKDDGPTGKNLLVALLVIQLSLTILLTVAPEVTRMILP